MKGWSLFCLQQGKYSQAETAIKSLFGKEKVAEIMGDLKASAQGSTEQDAGWFDLFSRRYWKGVIVHNIFMWHSQPCSSFGIPWHFLLKYGKAQ